jgi:hypothetical protein
MQKVKNKICITIINETIDKKNVVGSIKMSPFFSSTKDAIKWITKNF